MISDAKWKAFGLGLAFGGRLSTPIKSGNRRVTTGGANAVPKRIGVKDAITLNVGRVEGVRGKSYRVPVYISNNNVNNNGVGLAGYVALLRFDVTGLAFSSVEVSSEWSGSFLVDKSGVKAGYLKVTGLRTKQQGNLLDNLILFYVTFYVEQDYDSYSSGLPIELIGSPGSGSGSELYIIRPEIYDGYSYITPIGLQSGVISLVPLPKTRYPPLELPAPDNVLVVGSDEGQEETQGSSNFNFTLKATLSDIPGLGSGKANIIISIVVNGLKVASEEFPISVGVNNLSGRMKLKLPKGASYSDVDVVIELENEDGDTEGEYYLFIPAFGFGFTIETEVPDELVGQVPRKDLAVNFVELLVFRDFATLELTTGFKDFIDNVTINDLLEVFLDTAPEPPPSLETNFEVITVQDVNDAVKLSIVELNNENSTVSIQDIFLLEGVGKSLPNLDNFLDEVGVTDVKVLDFRSPLASTSLDTSSLGDEVSVSFTKVSMLDRYEVLEIRDIHNIESVSASVGVIKLDKFIDGLTLEDVYNGLAPTSLKTISKSTASVGDKYSISMVAVKWLSDVSLCQVTDVFKIEKQ